MKRWIIALPLWTVGALLALETPIQAQTDDSQRAARSRAQPDPRTARSQGNYHRPLVSNGGDMLQMARKHVEV